MSASKTPAASSRDCLAAIPPGVSVTHLDNGLAIIVREDHSAPVVSAQAWCMAGSIHEGEWLGAGLSHLLEHMLFKGTTTRPGSRIDQEVQEAGGYMNAYTSFDRTVYHIDVPNTGARVALDILCDIMQNASLPADELEKEMQVIVREMDMNQDDPGRRAGRRLFETAYTRSPYRFTVIGYPDVFHQVKPADVRAYYHRQYAPNNVFFVVVGDIQTAEVVDQIREAYKSSRSRPLPPSVLPEEPRQTAPREIIEEAPIELGYLYFAWHIPELRHPDVPLLDLLAAILGAGRSSRLYREVRETGIAHAADAWTYSPGQPGLFGFSATVEAAQFSGTQGALLAQIDRVRSERVSPGELQKAVKQFSAATLATRKTMQGQAQDLGGNWLVANDLSFSERYLAAVQRATPQALLRVARHYLVPENRTLYALLPTGAAPRTAAAVELFNSRPVQKFDLPNGLRLLVKEDHRLPFVEFRAVFTGGLLAETVENNGVTALMSKLLLKGTQTRSAEQISGEIEAVGGHLDTYSGNNSFGLHAEVLRPDFDLGLELMADVLLRPLFAQRELDREREIQLASLRAQKDHLLQSAMKLMRRTLFGSTGYGMDSLGAEGSVRGLQPGDLAAFHRRLTVPNNCVVAIFGDVEADSVHDAVQRALGGWARTPISGWQSSSSLAAADLRRVAEQRDKKQAVIVIGFPGATLFSPDRYALELLQEACSDLGSRLFLRVREKLGLAYYVGAQNLVGLSPGAFSFYAGTQPEKVELVEQEMFAETALLRAEGLSVEELARAKAKLVGQRKISRQDLGSLASAVSLDELYGLGFEHGDTEDARYEAVTREDIQRVANTYLVREKAVIATITP